jgi:hypothetical protein
MSNRALLAALIGGVTFLVVGQLLAAILPQLGLRLDAGPALGLDRDPAEWWALLLGSVILAGLIALIFDRYAAIITFRGGSETGAWIGALLFLGIDLLMLGGGRLANPNTIILDVVLGAILGAVTGGVVGAVLGYRNPDRRGGERRTRVRRV